jgi:Glycosyltransferase family 87
MPDRLRGPGSRVLILAAVLGSLGFVLAVELVNGLVAQGVYGPSHDTFVVSLYQQYGDATRHGLLPYRDFALEYPPFALPAFVLPSILTGGSGDADAYRAAFQGTMLACGVLTVVLVVFTLARLTERTVDVAIGTAFVAVSPLLLGPVMLARYDLWPAVLTAAGIAAIASDRYRVGTVFVVLAILAKVYPIVLVPLLGVYIWRRAGHREALACAGIGLFVLAVGLGPFLAVAPDGTLAALTRAFERPLQIESLGAAILVVLHGLAGIDLHVVFSSGSHNLDGPVPTLVAAVESAALAVALVAVWIRFARETATSGGLVVASAAAVCTFVALGKVLSDDYVIWLIPLVALVSGRTGRIALAGLASVLLLSGYIYPTHYAEYAGSLDLGLASVVLLRALVILGIAAYLGFAASPAPPGSTSRSTDGSGSLGVRTARP